MECPFRLCSAWVTLVIEQARPDDDELTIQRIPEHEVGGIPVRTQCPASLMPVPLNPDAKELLEEQAPGILRMIQDLDQNKAVTSRADKRSEPTRPDLRPEREGRRPNPSNSQWFRKGSNAGGRPIENTGEAAQGRPVVHPLPGQGVQPNEIIQPVDILGTQNRGNVEDHASMANGLLEHAKQLIGEIQETISSLTDRLDETAAGTATFQAKGEEIVGSIVQAAEGSQTHNYRIQDAMAMVHAAVNEQTQAAVDAIHLSKESLHRVYRTLAAAKEDLDNVVF